MSRWKKRRKSLNAQARAETHARAYATPVYACTKIIRATYVYGYAIRYSKYAKCTRTPGPRTVYVYTCVHRRAVGCRVRDRACACTDALHNIFAIVKCKAPARGSPAEPAFPRAAFAHCTAPQFCVQRAARGCVRGRKERKLRVRQKLAEMGRRRLESKFLSSHVNRDVVRAIEGLSTYFYIPFLGKEDPF